MRLLVFGLIAGLVVAGAGADAGADAQAEPPPEARISSVGYPSVAAALEDPHKRQGVVFIVDNGWTVASDPATHALWSFPPPGHPAYPSAARRQVVEKNGAVTVTMDVLCEGPKPACEDLVKALQTQNQQIGAGARENR